MYSTTPSQFTIGNNSHRVANAPLFKQSLFFFLFLISSRQFLEFALPMAGLEELKKKLVPLFDAEKGFPSGSTIDPSDSYLVTLISAFSCYPFFNCQDFLPTLKRNCLIGGETVIRWGNSESTEQIIQYLQH